jgi:hypothetical protein
MEITGVEELTRQFEELSVRFPDKAGDLLRKDARQLRKAIVESAKNLTDTDGTSKRSLGKTGSYRVSQVKGIGIMQYVEISAKSPHFHLVEHGHVLKSHSGATIGYVQGKHFLEKAANAYEREMKQHVETMVDALLREGGLI